MFALWEPLQALADDAFKFLSLIDNFLFQHRIGFSTVYTAQYFTKFIQTDLSRCVISV